MLLMKIISGIEEQFSRIEEQYYGKEEHFRNIAPQFQNIAPQFRNIAPQLQNILWASKMTSLAALEVTRRGGNEFLLDKIYVTRIFCKNYGILLLNYGIFWPGQKTNKFWCVFHSVSPVFCIITQFMHIKNIFLKKICLASFFLAAVEAQNFTPAQGGLPPPTQLTNTNTKS